jgi:hypothetical protein
LGLHSNLDTHARLDSALIDHWTFFRNTEMQPRLNEIEKRMLCRLCINKFAYFSGHKDVEAATRLHDLKFAEIEERSRSRPIVGVSVTHAGMDYVKARCEESKRLKIKIELAKTYLKANPNSTSFRKKLAQLQEQADWPQWVRKLRSSPEMKKTDRQRADLEQKIMRDGDAVGLGDDEDDLLPGQ